MANTVQQQLLYSVVHRNSATSLYSLQPIIIFVIIIYGREKNNFYFCVILHVMLDKQ